MAVALRGASYLGPQVQVANIRRKIARVISWDVPGNIEEALLASVLLVLILLVLVLSASVLLT